MLLRRGHIKEKIYDSEFSNFEEIIKNIDNYPKESIELDQHNFTKGFPNTYSYSKNLAERMLNANRGNLALIIIRPSVVGSSYREPVKGWIDNINAAGAILFGSTTGFLKEVEGEENIIIDLCAVDYCVNCIIAATALKAKENKCSIYHFASSSRNPLTVKFLVDVMHKYWKVAKVKSKKFGNSSLILYNSARKWEFNFTMRRVIPIKITKFLNSIKVLHTPDIDKADKMIEKVRLLNSLFSNFTHNEWVFDTEAIDQMNELIPKCDQEEFPYDMKELNWEECINYYLYGLRRFIVKDVNVNDPLEYVDYLYTCNRKYFSDIKFILSHGVPPHVLKPLNIKSNIFNSKAVKKAIEDKAEEIKQTNSKLQYTDEDSYKASLQLAYSQFESINSVFDMKMFKIFGYTIYKLLNTIFEAIIVNNKGMQYIKLVDHNRNNVPIIFIPMHKSYMDFLLVAYALTTYNISNPYITAGEDFMKIPLIGKMFEHCGAFYIRRKIKYDELYKKILQEYVTQQLKAGNNLEFFIEGGRERYGMFREPKYGILSYVIDAVINNKIEDALIVPISISYDKVLEDTSFITELKGGKKVDESLIRIIKSASTLFRKYGKARLHFDKPKSVKELLTKITKPSFNPYEGGLNFKQTVRKIGRYISNSFVENTYVPLTAIVSMALLKHRFTVTESVLFEYSIFIHNIIVSMGYKTIAKITLEDIRKCLTFLSEFVEKKSTLEHTVSIAGNIKSSVLMLTFYKNNLIHVFFLDSILCVCLDSSIDVTKEKCYKLLDMIDSEYTIELHEGQHKQFLDLTIDGLVKKGAISKEEGKLKVINQAYCELMKEIIMPFIDTYYVSFIVASGLKGQKSIPEKDLPEVIVFQCEYMLKEGKIKYLESGNTYIIQNAINKMKKDGIIELKSPTLNNSLIQYVYVLTKIYQAEAKITETLKFFESIRGNN